MPQAAQDPDGADFNTSLSPLSSSGQVEEEHASDSEVGTLDGSSHWIWNRKVWAGIGSHVAGDSVW